MFHTHCTVFVWHVDLDFLARERDLSGVLSRSSHAGGGDGDFLTTVLGDDTVAGLAVTSCGSPLCWTKFTTAMKSKSCAWLMTLGIDGNNVTTESSETSGFPAGRCCVNGISCNGGWSCLKINRGNETSAWETSAEPSCDVTAAPCWLDMRCWSLPGRLIHPWQADTLCCAGLARLFHKRCTRLPCWVGRLPGLWQAVRQCWVDSLCRVSNLCRAVRPWRYVSCRDCICRLLRYMHRTFLVHSCPPSWSDTVDNAHGYRISKSEIT